EDFDFHAWNHEQDAGRPWEEAEYSGARTHPHWQHHIVGYRRHFDDSLTGPIDGTVAIVAELHESGVPLFALTNWSAELFPAARRRFEFLTLFDDIIVSGDEGIAKPAPEIFAILRRRVGQPLGRCLFVDDSVTNVQAARRTGLDAVVFTDPDALRSELRGRGLPV
ncbi:MAG: HAD-IA family hydrolase, partial [Nocardioidaceae bacterium]